MIKISYNFISLVFVNGYNNIMQRKEQTRDELSQNKAFELKRYTAQKCMDQYSNMLVRPPRFLYCEEILNPSIRYKNRFEHYTFQIPFKLSLYCPRAIKYVLLYLHGNSSSRYEGFSQLHHLPPDVALACFDFDGCGNRTEKLYISLGKYESKQVDIAVKFLKQRGHKVAIWGRSMGAISALLSSQSNVVIADSAFSSLYQTSKDLAKTQVCCPLYCCFQCFFPCFFCIVGKDVEKKSLMNPSQLQIKQSIAKSNPNRYILLLAAKNDTMINPKHTQILFDSFPGKNKKKIIFEGTHNSERPKYVFNQIFSFAQSALNQNIIETQQANNVKNEQIDSLQCVRNDKMVSIEMPSQLGVNQTIKVFGKSEKANNQNKQ